LAKKLDAHNTKDEEHRMTDETKPQDDATTSPASASAVWPLAWAVASGSHRVYDVYDNEAEAVAICLWLRDEGNDVSWVTLPLYPTQPTLTDAERTLLGRLACEADHPRAWTNRALTADDRATLRDLLERLK